MNFWDEFKSGRWVPNTIAVCSGVVLYLLLTNIGMVGVFFGSLWTMISPLVIGVAIAYLLDPIVKIFEQKGFARKPSVVMMLLVILLVAGILVLALVPQFVSGFLQFIENLGGYISSLEKQIMKMDTIGNGNEISASVVKILDNIADFLDGNAIISTSSNIGSSMMTYVVSFILAIYYLMAKGELLTWFRRFLQKALGRERYRKLSAFSSRCHRILISYITCSLIEAVLVGIVNLLFMLIFRMPYAAMISCIVAITNLAPTFGPIVGCLIGMFILLLVKPSAMIWFLLFTLVLQTIDGYIIKPKLFGNTLGVSSLLILIFLILGGRLFGVWGILLSIPAAAILQYFFYEILFPITRKEHGSLQGGEENSIWPDLKKRMARRRSGENGRQKRAAAEGTAKRETETGRTKREASVSRRVDDPVFNIQMPDIPQPIEGILRGKAQRRQTGENPQNIPEEPQPMETSDLETVDLNEDDVES